MTAGARGKIYHHTLTAVSVVITAIADLLVRLPVACIYVAVFVYELAAAVLLPRAVDLTVISPIQLHRSRGQHRPCAGEFSSDSRF